MTSFIKITNYSCALVLNKTLSMMKTWDFFGGKYRLTAKKVNFMWMACPYITVLRKIWDGPSGPSITVPPSVEQLPLQHSTSNEHWHKCYQIYIYTLLWSHHLKNKTKHQNTFSNDFIVVWTGKQNKTKQSNSIVQCTLQCTVQVSQLTDTYVQNT